MGAAKSCSRRLSCNRALVLDSLHFSRKVPLFPLEKEFDLAPVARSRSAAPVRISWSILFLKAHALVAAEEPRLRQALMRWPLPHLYEHSESVATLAIHREYDGEDRLCWGRFIAPEGQSLEQLQKQLDHFQHDPVESIFRRQVRMSKLPQWLRRIGWRMSLHLSGAKRAKRLGTFSVSSVAGLGATNRFHPTFLTSSLTYGPVDSAGRALVTLLCDHRVIDGTPGARALNRLEAVLNGPIAGELSQLSQLRKAA